MPSNPEELAEEMAALHDADLDPESLSIIAEIANSPEGQLLTQELERLHRELVVAPIAENLKKIQECQWKIFQLSRGAAWKRRLN